MFPNTEYSLTLLNGGLQATPYLLWNTRVLKMRQVIEYVVWSLTYNLAYFDSSTSSF